MIYKKIVNSLRSFKPDLSLSYIPLGVICLFAVYRYRSSQGLQLQVIFIAAVLYVSIALIHHYFDKTLTLEVIIEYILIALLVLAVTFGVFF